MGSLYSEPEYKDKKDTGYNIFYMGINIGAFICNIIAAFMRNKFSWDAAFISAGIGLLVGLVIFSFGRKHLVKANEMKPAEEGDSKISDVLLKVFLPAILAAIFGYFIPKDIFGSDITDAFIFACIPVIYFYASLYFKAKEDEKKPIGTLLSIFLVSMFFWAIFKQNGTALTRWANYYTDREIPAKAVPAAQSLYLVDGKKGTEGKLYQDKEVTVYNNQFQAQKDDKGETLKEQGKDVYFKNISPERRAELEKDPSKPVYLFNTELLQSVNPFWVIALTPFYIFLWAFLRKRGKEPTTASKIVLGLFLTAMSCLVMVAAVYFSKNGGVKASALWLVAAYASVTLGELCLSPMGLSITSKLSPKRITNLMMGGFFLANSVGNKLSGILSSTWYSYENKMNYFLFNFGLLLFATILGLLMLKKWNAVMKEKGV
jgi:POT family proton-dependent oligopeptide transporter